MGRQISVYRDLSAARSCHGLIVAGIVRRRWHASFIPDLVAPGAAEPQALTVVRRQFEKRVKRTRLSPKSFACLAMVDSVWSAVYLGTWTTSCVLTGI